MWDITKKHSDWCKFTQYDWSIFQDSKNSLTKHVKYIGIKKMEIHERYYSRDPNIAQDLLESEISVLSDKLFGLIKFNRVGDILTLFQTTSRSELYILVNTRNSGFQNMLPVNYSIKCSASHLVLAILLRLGAKYDDSTESPLLVAIRSGLMNSVKILIISGADVNILDKEGFSILHWAAFRKNILMVRLILKLTDFTFHNHDRNTQRITPLGIAVHQKDLELLKELLKCPRVDPNIIDSTSHRYVYDLAAESGQFQACLELEKAFKARSNISEMTKKHLKRNFHDLHEYTIEAVIQHQFRSQWLTFKDDPRGAFQPIDNPSLRLSSLPHQDNWIVLKEEGALDNIEGWKYSYTSDNSDKPLIVNYSGDGFVEGGALFEYIDNYRFRILARMRKNQINKR